MKNHRDRRDVRFDLGNFVIDPEVTELLSYAQVNSLVLRHGRGDWGRVGEVRRQWNEAFAHPKSRTKSATAESIHTIANARVCVLTRQEGARRTTHLFLV